LWLQPRTPLLRPSETKSRRYIPQLVHQRVPWTKRHIFRRPSVCCSLKSLKRGFLCGTVTQSQEADLPTWTRLLARRTSCCSVSNRSAEMKHAKSQYWESKTPWGSGNRREELVWVFL